MRQLCFYLFFLFLTVNLLSLEYTESSNGLNNPQLEGGRTELEFADIDADGNIDILSIGDHGSPYINTSEHGIMVWFGDGNGNWNVYQNGNFGYGGIAVGDVNNDGFLDVGYAMHHNYSSTDFGDQLIEVALGDGTGMNWIPWDDGLATNGETWGMFGTDFADVDNDGDLDVGSNSFGFGAGVHVYLNQSNGSWLQSFGFIGGNSNMDFDFGDINKDGNVDFAVKHQYGTVYFGDGTGNFVLYDMNLPTAGILGRRGSSLADVDNDGGKDLTYVNSNGGIEIWVWDETEDLWIDFSGTLPINGNYEVAQLYDMNVDGYIDVCAFGNGIFTLWLGDGAGNWTLDAQFNTPPDGDCEAFRVGGDIDHNGFPDLAFVTDEGSWPSSQNHLHCFKETSIVDSLCITPMFPRGNEKFEQNSIQFIDWVSAVPEGDFSLIKLEFSINGIGGNWTTFADSLPNNGRFQWSIPEVGSANCYIRYTVWTTTDTATATTPHSFTVVGFGTDIENNLIENERIILRNYPNPFNPETTISFSTTELTENTEINIYNLKGQKVKTLECINRVNAKTTRSFYSISWNGTDVNNQPVGSGIYFYRLNLKNSPIRKMILVK